MRHALFVPPFGELADPAAVVRLAAEAERHGWEGLFLWDHMIRPPGDPQEIADPWILLAAVAATTSSMRIGTMITPLARRRPQKVARETVTLDHLSGGRVVLGIGLGVDNGGELGRFGECTDEVARAGILDEAVDLLLALWSGDEVRHPGPRFTADGVRFLPTSVQRPRIPIWGATVGTRRRVGPLRRAARLDGVFPVNATLDQFRGVVEELHAMRGSLDGYEVAAQVPPNADDSVLDGFERAGATWAMHSFPVHSTVDQVAEVVARWPRTMPVDAGPR
jgi:alkanesulfonate monooxygenase SsuD/methylene tetrahydromethanopterin reductase-like flavin-dependent oxidoreductase (luciferase family)